MWYMTRCVMEPWTAAVSLISALAAGSCAFICWWSTPSVLQRNARTVAQALGIMEDRVVAMEGRWAARSKEYEALHEAIMDDVDRAEKKRRQASAAAARSAHAQKPDGEVDLTDINALRRLALQRGLL